MKLSAEVKFKVKLETLIDQTQFKRDQRRRLYLVDFQLISFCDIFLESFNQ